MKQAVEQIVTDYGLVLRAPEWKLVLAGDHVFAASIEGVCATLSKQVLTHAGSEFVTQEEVLCSFTLNQVPYTKSQTTAAESVG